MTSIPISDTSPEHLNLLHDNEALVLRPRQDNDADADADANALSASFATSCPVDLDCSVTDEDDEEDDERGEFELFPRLPFELREMIWEDAVDKYNSTVVSVAVQQVIKHNCLWPRKIEEPFISYCIPTLLQVNQQARQVTLKTYTPLFGPALGNKPFYMDVTKDVLFFKALDAPDILLKKIAANKKYKNYDYNEQKIRYVVVGGYGNRESVDVLDDIFYCNLIGPDMLVFEKPGGSLTRSERRELCRDQARLTRKWLAMVDDEDETKASSPQIKMMTARQMSNRKVEHLYQSSISQKLIFIGTLEESWLKCHSSIHSPVASAP